MIPASPIYVALVWFEPNKVKLPRQVKPPSRHCRRVHEDDVDARNVERHPRRQHDARLWLKQQKQNSILSGPEQNVKRRNVKIQFQPVITSNDNWSKFLKPNLTFPNPPQSRFSLIPWLCRRVPPHPTTLKFNFDVLF